MVWVQFTENEMHNWLKDNACIAVDFDDDCLDDHIMVYKGPNDTLVPVQIRKVYYGYYVTKICMDLGINIPHRFVKLREQLDNLRKIQEADQKKKAQVEAAKKDDPKP